MNPLHWSSFVKSQTRNTHKSKFRGILLRGEVCQKFKAGEMAGEAEAFMWRHACSWPRSWDISAAAFQGCTLPGKIAGGSRLFPCPNFITDHWTLRITSKIKSFDPMGNSMFLVGKFACQPSNPTKKPVRGLQPGASSASPSNGGKGGPVTVASPGDGSGAVCICWQSKHGANDFMRCVIDWYVLYCWT